MTIMLLEATGIGALLGFLLGLTGAGGFLIVPALLWFTPLSMLAATATSMTVIAVVSGGGFLIYLTHAQPSLLLFAGLVSGGAFGVLLGNRLALQMSTIKLQRVFALLLVLVVFSLATQKILQESNHVISSTI